MENTLSPEEKLFKVIKEGSQTKNVAATGTIPSPVASAGNLKLKQSPDSPAKPDAKSSLSTAGTVAPAVPIVPPKAKPAEKPASSLPSSPGGAFRGFAQALAFRYSSGAQFLAMFQRIDVINRLLAIVLVVLLGAFIYSTVLGRPSIEKTIRHFPSPPARSMKADNQGAFMPAGEYVKMSKQRDIFSREQNAAVKNTAVADKPDIARIKTDLQLVGIYFSEKPEVIIEDKSEKKTYFLKEGGNIKGIKVKSILQDRVILESGGLEWELM
jgi:hypothetical protein